jgi:hypothetical protein
MVRRRVGMGDFFADGHLDFKHLVGLHLSGHSITGTCFSVFQSAV